MLAKRDKQLGAEEAASGQPSLWASVYRYFCCPSHLCQLGPYCQVDLADKKHYKLLWPDIESLAEYVQEGHILKLHKHMPIDICQKLYNKEKESLKTYKKAITSVTNLLIPITITVLPALAGILAPNMPSKSTLLDRFDILSLLEDQVEGYSTWHESRVKTEGWKAACSVVGQSVRPQKNHLI